MIVRSEAVAALEDSWLALESIRLEAAEALELRDAEVDALLYVREGSCSLVLPDGDHELVSDTAALVLAAEPATLTAGAEGAAVALACVGGGGDRHAPLGPRAAVARLDREHDDSATGARSFQILFGPHNGSTRATLFVGYVPPGKAPWHYHLYDEIVLVRDGTGRLHVGDRTEELGPDSAFRLRPREVHIVENTSADRELVLLGFFAPAGISPSAAYLPAEVAAVYRFVG